MQSTMMIPQSSVAEPIKLGNVQLVSVESLWVLTWLAHSKNEHNKTWTCSSCVKHSYRRLVVKKFNCKIWKFQFGILYVEYHMVLLVKVSIVILCHQSCLGHLCLMILISLEDFSILQNLSLNLCHFPLFQSQV